MNWPPVRVLIPVALHLFKDAAKHSFDETEAFLASRCDVSAEELQSKPSSASRTRWINRVRKSWDNLKGFGLTRFIRHKTARITKFGMIVAENDPPEITPRYLEKFPQFSKSDYAIKHEAGRDIRVADGAKGEH